MRWLRRLLTPSPITPRYGVETDGVDPIDWARIEDRLVQLADQAIAAFANKHATDIFYGLAFDCSSQSGEILLCANTRNGLLEVAHRFVDHPKLYRGKSPQAIAAELEWDIGGWKYHAFNLGMRRWSGGWGAIQAQVANATNIFLNSRNESALRQLQESFMSMAARALIRVGAMGAVASLGKDGEFRLLCTDESESPEEGFARLARLEHG
jgi:hypothetical protein